MKIFELIEKPEKLKRLKAGCIIMLVFIVAVDFFVPRHHSIFWWDDLPGFDALYGIVSCLLIIFVSKTIGHLGIMQPEDYYHETEEDENDT